MNSLPPLTLDALQNWLVDNGESAYRLRQIRRWVFRHRASRWDEMTDLPAQLRTALASTFCILSTRIIGDQQAEDGTRKLLLELTDGGRIECVLLPSRIGYTVCISTQVGCAMGCVFCATGLDGVKRNLTSAEITEQVLRLQQCLPQDERVRRIVVMGMGEPLANLDALLPALDELRDADALGISSRRITISTVGIPAAIDRLAHHKPNYPLALSLHAPNDTLRDRLVPVNRKIGIVELLRATDAYFEISGRRVTFEYVLLAEINDRPEHAHELSQLLRGRPALINLIPYNPVDGLAYRAPHHRAVAAFREILEQAGLNVQQRHRKGERIRAACGQLRQRSTRP